MITKLYPPVFILFLFFISCVDNSDEKKGGSGGGGGEGGGSEPTTELLDLNEENILGSWEVYFYTKAMHAPALDLNVKYRYTDDDGFSVTFEEGGVFYEKNVFGMTVIEGRYEFVKNEMTNKNDSIRFIFVDKKTGKETRNSAAVPYLYNNRFIYHSIYHGTTKEDNILFNVEDFKYYRNLERDPNYYPSDNPAFKKTSIDENELQGSWNLFKAEMRLDEEWLEVDKEKYGTITTFRIENGERIFDQYAPGNIFIRTGKYRIVDDVIDMYSNEKDPDTGEDFRSFQYWVRDWQTAAGGTEIMIEGFIDRNPENMLQEREKKSYHRKVN